MIALDYHSILGAQYKEYREYKIVVSVYFVLRPFFLANRFLSRTNKKLVAYLLELKGTYVYLLENVEEIRNENLSPQIASIEETIKYIYVVQNDLEQHLVNPRSKALKATHDIIAEVLEIMHDTLRLLKKNTLKQPLTAVSEEAKAAVSRSGKTMNRILYGR
jgi:DUF438 domain-containing protein